MTTIGSAVRRERWYDQAAPMLTVLGAMLLDLLWVPIPGFSAVAPAFPIMAVYCWTAWRPQLLPYTAVFVAGLLEDLIRGTPIGTASIALLAVQGFVWAQKRYLGTRSFEVLWLGFAATALLGAIVMWCAVSFAYRTPLSPWPGGVQYLLTVAAFPPIAFMLLRVDRGLSRGAVMKRKHTLGGFGSRTIGGGPQGGAGLFGNSAAKRSAARAQTRARRQGQTKNREAELDQRKVFTRRAMVFGGVQVAAAAALGGRMYQLQVLQADDYALQAEDNRVNRRLLIPPRGRLLDRNGQAMATNREDYRVYVIADRTPNLQMTVDRLAQLLQLTDDERARLVREIRKRRHHQAPFPVAFDLNWDQLARIEANTPDLPGVFIEKGLTRHYPASNSTAHVVGYVAPPTEDDQASDGDPLLTLPEFRLGKGGIERILDKPLRGKSGYAEVEINAAGKVQRELDRVEGTPGTDVTLSVDLELQRYAMGLLAQHESGAAVLLDVHTGEVAVLAAHPGFDPNAFVGGIGAELWRTLNANPTAPLNNKCVTGQYSPGSTYKMMTALAGLEFGAINERTVFSCGGALQLGGHALHCWKRGGHGGLSVRDAIKQSCDVFFYNVAMQTGIDRFADVARRFSIGSLTGIELPHEKPGLMPDTQWKRTNFKNDQKFHAGELAIIGIGQGYVLTTPLHLAVMTARIVNGGRAVVPKLIKSPPGLVAGSTAKKAGDPPSLGLNPRHLDFIASAMSGVVNEPGGTAQRVRIDEPGLQIGGKTGTAQVRRITVAERAKGVIRNEDLPWDKRDHALFVAFGPVAAPRFACAVVVEHGGGGGAVAAPIARELMLEAMKRYIPVSERKIPEAARRSRAERGRE